MRFHTLHFPGHPQETTENAVDMAHLRHVHGYDSVRQVGEVTIDIDGAYMRSCFDLKPELALGGR
ncbi:hypothetical protein [Candidatus Rariloculus sp.]|uniref:hypothetical protein n=1 Tax=Candidatus Rariloculus sp. TaxID=3101265 RepID=UPI003D130076